MLQRHLAIGGLDEEDMRQAAAEHTHLELGRARTEVVAGEVGAAIANDLKVSDTAAADAAAILGLDAG
jgi:hypothetical protein